MDYDELYDKVDEALDNAFLKYYKYEEQSRQIIDKFNAKLENDKSKLSLDLQKAYDKYDCFKLYTTYEEKNKKLLEQIYSRVNNENAFEREPVSLSSYTFYKLVKNSESFYEKI